MKRHAACVLVCGALWLWAPSGASAQAMTVYQAKKIVTMDPSLPVATAVAVRGDRIVAVGTPETLKPWLAVHPHRVDDRFKDKVVFPGFIDPHLHPGLGASLLQTAIIAPEDWELPGGVFKGVKDRASYLTRLGELLKKDGASSEPFVSWGWNVYWHGQITRQDLDRIAPTRPVIIIQRSSHERVLNTAALSLFKIGPEVEAEVPGQIDWKAGRFWENGQAVLRRSVDAARPDEHRRGLRLVADLIHRGGVTTISDPGGAPMPGTQTWQMLRETIDADDTPFRTLLVPGARSFDALPGDGLAAKFTKLSEASTRRLIFTKGEKSFVDGAMFAQYMQMGPPGYIDGHAGEWLGAGLKLLPELRPFWNAGFDINIHVNGDKGVDVTLDTLQALQDERPRFDVRYILQHLGFSRQDQVVRMARLGAMVSATGYYLYFLGDEVGVGPERADQMTRMGSLVRNGVKIALHSDLPMGPVKPLLAVWSHATRKTSSGTVRGPQEALTLDQAFRAVTIDAAWSLRMDHEIGSIAAGKKADFTVLDEDPYTVPLDHVKDINVWGTVFEGTVRPVTHTPSRTILAGGR